MTRDHRRLAAIISADVVGYSLLMGRDDSATLAGLKAHRRELIDPKIAEYGGRIVKTTGDGLLLEFPSVVDAVRCAVDVQRGMAERNAGVPPEQRIDFRIGVNVGDIIIDDDDIFGDGVNVAARLQTLADPGGICVSKVVRDQVLDKLSFIFEDLGAQEVKNIARPIEVYRIRDEATARGTAPTGPATTPWTGKGSRSFRARWHWWVIGTLALGLGGITAWQLPRMLGTASILPPAAFSVAVMPFVGTAGVSADEQFADALTENLRTLLGKSSVLTVVSGRKSLSYKGKEIDAHNIGRELNVRYLVDGEVRSNGAKTAITAYLIDAESGSTAWSDRLEAATSSAEETGAQARKLRRLLGAAIYHAEELRATTHPVPDSAPDLWLRGNAALRLSMGEPEKLSAARKFYDDALRIHPDYVPALTSLAGLLDNLITADLDSDRSTRAQRIEELDGVTARAVKINDSDRVAWHVRALALIWLGRFDQALAANTKAQSLDDIPSSILVDQQVDIVVALDRPEEALALAQRATSIEPASNTGGEGYSIREVCITNLLLGRYSEAATFCERSAARDNWWLDQMYLAAIYAQLGDSEKAAAAKAALLKQKPRVTIDKLKATDAGASNPAYLHRAETYLYAGLRKAGIPEK